MKSIEAYRQGGVFYLSRTSDAPNSNPSYINITECDSIYDTYSWLDGGFVYMDNPNAEMKIEKSSLEQMKANYTGGVFYIKTGKQLTMSYSSITEVNATVGAMMYSIATGVTFNSTRSTYKCLLAYSKNAIQNQLDLSSYDGDLKKPNTTNAESIFYILGAVGTFLDDSEFLNCFVPNEGGIFSLILTSISDSASSFHKNAALYGGVANCNSCTMDFTGTRFEKN